MAEVVVHEVVSNVDTAIVLRNPTIHFAAWEDTETLESLERGAEEATATAAIEAEKAAGEDRERAPALSAARKNGKMGKGRVKPDCLEYETPAIEPTENWKPAVDDWGYAVEELKAYGFDEGMKSKKKDKKGHRYH